MKNLLEYKKYNPESEYKEETRREINIDSIRKSKDYKNIIDLGFKETTSHQQEINNTIKFQRVREREKESGHTAVFYTIHPSGIVRRYNPEKNKDTPEGFGNDIKNFHSPFKTSREYLKGLRYLWQYLKRKQERKNYR